MATQGLFKSDSRTVDKTKRVIAATRSSRNSNLVKVDSETMRTVTAIQNRLNKMSQGTTGQSNFIRKQVNVDSGKQEFTAVNNRIPVRIQNQQ